MPPRRLHLIANTRSGRGGGASLAELAKSICEEFDCEFHVYSVEHPRELESRAREAVDKAVDSDDIILAAGGDGTLRTVAEVVRGSRASFAAIPCGTFNYFARSHGIPLDAEKAIRLALTGEAQPIQLGEINGRTFIINASLGLYARSIEEREAKRQIFGRFRLVSVLSTLGTLLSHHRNLHVKLKEETHGRGQVNELKTPLIFIGNNALQLENLKLKASDCIQQQKLAVLMLKPLNRLAMMRVLLRGLTKSLSQEEKLISFCLDEMQIETKIKAHTVALDGEMFEMRSPYRVLVVPDAIRMVKLTLSPTSATSTTASTSSDT